jgi:hypothetical protein
MAIGWRIPIHNGHGAGLPLLLRHQVSVHETIHGRQDKEDEHRRGDHTSYDDARQELLCGRGLPSLWRSCGSWAFRFLRRHLGSVPPGAPPPPAGDHASLGVSPAHARARRCGRLACIGAKAGAAPRCSCWSWTSTSGRRWADQEGRSGQSGSGKAAGNLTPTCAPCRR